MDSTARFRFREKVLVSLDPSFSPTKIHAKKIQIWLSIGILRTQTRLYLHVTRRNSVWTTEGFETMMGVDISLICIRGLTSTSCTAPSLLDLFSPQHHITMPKI